MANYLCFIKQVYVPIIKSWIVAVPRPWNVQKDLAYPPNSFGKMSFLKVLILAPYHLLVGVNQSGETSGHWLGGKLAKLSEMDRAKWDSTSGPRRHPPPWWLWGCPRYRATQNSWSLYWNQTYSPKELSHVVFLGHMGDQKKEGLDVPRKDRRKIICCANNTIDEVTKSLLVNWNYTERK